MSRTPKPSAVKQAMGNPGKRATGKQEPDPEYLRDMSPPSDLPEGAQAIWREVVPMLARNRLATVADIRALRKLCVAEWQYDLAVEKLKTAGPLSGKGMSPWEQTRSMNFKQLLSIYDRFGMSPRARAQIQIQPQQLLPGFDNQPTNGDKAAQPQGEEFFH